MAWVVFTALKSEPKKLNAEMLKVITDIRKEMTLQNHWNTKLYQAQSTCLQITLCSCVWEITAGNIKEISGKKKKNV